VVFTGASPRKFRVIIRRESGVAGTWSVARVLTLERYVSTKKKGAAAIQK
jgi:hypothetical protein